MLLTNFVENFPGVWGQTDKAPSLEDRAIECEPIYSNNHIIWSTNRGWSGGRGA